MTIAQKLDNIIIIGVLNIERMSTINVPQYVLSYFDIFICYNYYDLLYFESITTSVFQFLEFILKKSSFRAG